MPLLKYILPLICLVASSNSYAIEPSYDLQHIYELTKSLEFTHWAEELIPGAPEKGVLLFKVVALTITLPLFGVLLVWGIINDLQSDNVMSGMSRVDYLGLAKRIFIFIIFLGFGTAIYGYMASLQHGMHSIIEIVCSQDSDFFLKAFYKESAANQNKMTRAIGAGKQEAINSLLNTAKELIKYKDEDRGAIRTVTRAHYMALPLAAYNEALLLYSGDKQVSLPSDTSLKTYKNAAAFIEEYLSLMAGDGGNSLRAASISAYARILKAFPEYPTVYSKTERDARASLNEAISDTISTSESAQNASNVPMIASAPNPKPPSDANLAEYLLESISKNSEANIAVPKFAKEQIMYLVEYDPVIRQGINRIIWELYNRDVEELDGLSIEAAELKVAEAKCSSSPEEARKHALPANYESLLKERVSQLIIAHITVIGATKPVSDGEGYMSPSAFLEELTRTPAWYQRIWDWGASKVQSAYSLAAGSLKSVVDLPQRLIEKIVEYFVEFMFWIEKIIVYVMVVIVSYILTLQFFFASITSCFVACKQTENIFYYNFKLCLHFALIPFTCMLLLTIFNVAINNMWSSLVPPPNGIVGGAGIVGAAALPAAGFAASGYALQVALVISVFQVAGMVFLAVYSVKAAGILVRGGGVGGSLLAAAGGALLAGKVAASAFGMSMGVPGASSIAKTTKTGGLGGMGGGTTESSSGNPHDKPPQGNGIKSGKNPSTVPMPPDTSKDKVSAPQNNAQPASSSTPSHMAQLPPINTATRSNEGASVQSEGNLPNTPQSSNFHAVRLFGKYADVQKKVYGKMNPRMGLWLKGAVSSVFPSFAEKRSRDNTNNDI